MQYLLSFLGRVKEHSEKNKMAIHNLATVFGPNLLRPREQGLSQLLPSPIPPHSFKKKKKEEANFQFILKLFLF